MKNIFKNLSWYLLGFLVILLVFSFFQTGSAEPKKIDVTTLVSQIEAGQVKSIEVSENRLNVVLSDDSKQILQKENSESLSTLLKN